MGSGALLLHGFLRDALLRDAWAGAADTAN
jgi:hypothetical protein